MDNEEKYYYRNPDGNVKGPVSARILFRRKAAQEVTENTEVCKKGGEEWFKYTDLEKQTSREQLEEPIISPPAGIKDIAQSTIDWGKITSTPAGIKSQPESDDDSNALIGCLVVVAVIGVILSFIFPFLLTFVLIGIFGFCLSYGYEQKVKGNALVGISIIILSICVTLGVGYFVIREMSKPSESVDQKLEEKARGFLSTPAGRELYNEHMKEQREK